MEEQVVQSGTQNEENIHMSDSNNTLLGKIVKHQSFGEGEIIDVKPRRNPEAVITVDFSGTIKKFIYPGAFEQYLSSDDIYVSENAKVAIYAMQGIDYKPNYEGKKDKAKRPRAPKASITEERRNIAFKCNYNDGGKDSSRIGFCGICSDEMIDVNIFKEQRAKCMDPSCPCMQYRKGEISREQLDAHMKDGGFVCYESMMLRDWRASAGFFTSGEKRGEPMKLRNINKNSLAVLSTKLPKEPESDRLVYAVFLIDEYDEGTDTEEAYVLNHSQYKLSFNENERLLFWDYHANDNNPSRRVWSSGLFRYIGDDESVQILRDAVKIKKGTPDETLAKRFLDYYCRVNGIDEKRIGEPYGALKRKPD
jgi:hypothetical protein